ncbi:GTPase Era, mitochondrial isoform X1 [Bufo gargarizans]|uniref:GTPase Era, mitochondrial isoform X1 n=1 Tax=Bufo gargarizans TaxID=30331 RepID=UPI001CF20952|nr:GTPase Era, mitochondrial isoform X1 [Bufo gargarizans]
MWCAVLRSVRAVRVVAESKGAGTAILLRKREHQRVNRLAACLYGKDSAIGTLLGVNKHESTSELLSPQAPAISFNKDDQDRLLKHAPDQPENPKVLKLAIIGAPNAGKSTLSNQLLGRKVFPVSSKVHTTRCKAQGILTEGDTQMILLDTPGMVNSIRAGRHKLEKTFQEDPWQSVKLADVVLVLVDVSDKWMRKSLHSEVLKCLAKNSHIPSILVLNKVDLLKQKSSLLEVTGKLTEGMVKGRKAVIKSSKKTSDRSVQPDEESASVLKKETRDQPEGHRELSGVNPKDGGHQDKTGWPHFQEVFMLSALEGDEVETLKKYLLTLAKPGEWEYHSKVVTTQAPQEICNNIIREKLLEYLPQEIPYNITQVNEFWEEGSGGELVIKQTLLVPKENHVKLLIGPSGELISRIAKEAGCDLMNAFLCDVRLQLAVKYRKR